MLYYSVELPGIEFHIRIPEASSFFSVYVFFGNKDQVETFVDKFDVFVFNNILLTHSELVSCEHRPQKVT
jgi:hypothetical protein